MKMIPKERKEAGFIGRWFGFAGWKAMSVQARILTQIVYRVFFCLGLAGIIIGHGIIVGQDPGGLALIGMIGIWFLLFQAMVNFVFIEGSR